MFEARAGTARASQTVDEDQVADATDDEIKERRHGALMELLKDESELQAEERLQMAIDEDYYDHLQWRPEDAEELIERGQAPVVFNESRQTIDWITGMEKRMRKDYKVLPREEGDENGAELKTKLIKYTDDVNMTHWHRSRAFKQTATAGLGWLEEGINPDPEAEMIFSGTEDWRNVYRDSRSRELDMGDARYLFRRKVTDLDYAIALLPDSAEYLRNSARLFNDHGGEDDVWYLGEKLTGASETQWADVSAKFGDRSAYVKRNGHYDSGRRQSVELLECWYRVPEAVKVFGEGPMQGKIFEPKEDAHVAAAVGVRMYSTVKMRMRVMIATKERCLWDGPSPFKHQKFLLVPIWGYRRARDGQVYGPMRGMRDIQDDLNKRRSKALYALSTNRIVMDDDAVEDIEELRQEAARPDGIIKKKKNSTLTFEKNVGDFQGNLELAAQDSQMLRNVGGVTNENLGRDTNAQSGIAIERKQDQGSLTTAELFDNLMLAIRLAGQIRLSHIEQYWTEEKAVRIVGENKPIEWVKVNARDPVTGEILNDITATQADFIVDTQDYRASLAQAALDQMFELLGKIATFAPQVVLSVLDLLVESADIKNKDEWVARIRKLNGQRDPTKPPSPEELAAEKQGKEKQAEKEALDFRMMNAKVQETEAKAKLLDADEVFRRVDAMHQALVAAGLLATTPGIAPAADAITSAAGMEDNAAGALDPALMAATGLPAPAAPGAQAMPPGIDPAAAVVAEQPVV
ncbi:hypothetical protein D9M73_70800 [compost metagenome]